MARGFTDDNGRFRPTDSGNGTSSREKSIKTSGTKIERKAREVDEKLNILVKKKPNRTDAFFYKDGIPIAEITYNGWKIFAEPSGEVRVLDTKTNEEIRNDNLTEYWDEFNDKTIYSDRFVWEHNNWFEIGAWNPDGKFVDLMIAENDYDSAINAMKDVLSELKEQGCY